MKNMLRMLAIAAAMLVVTACGGSSTSGDIAATQTNDATTVPADEAPRDAGASTSAGTTSDEPKTLDEYLGGAATLLRGGGGLGPGATFDQDQVLEQQQLVQAEIQVCMRAQGFEYVPEAVGDGLRFFLTSQSTELAPAEYAETSGFGISTRFDAILEGDFDLSETANANDQHIATLSEGEADAWQFALRGAPPVRNDEGQLVNPETGEVVQGRGATGGCTREAETAVRGDFSALADLSDEFAELEERIAADPRVAEIARAWVDCMASEGFDYQDEAEARADIRQQFNPVLRSFFQSADSGGAGQDGQQQGQAEQGGGNRLARIVGLELTADQEAELQSLQDLERAIATASISCQGDTMAEVAEITERYEAEFVAENRSTLESLSS